MAVQQASLFAFAAFCASLALLVSGSQWSYSNQPSLFGKNYDFNLSNLPPVLKLSKMPWSDTYWPSYQSGIAHRWNSHLPQDWSYKLHSKDELLKNLTINDLKELSPAEKYDIFMQRYDYPTVRNEWMRTSPSDAGWEGLCHGWAPAAYIYEQPKPVDIRNNDGILIPFGSSDVKALLTYYMGEYTQVSYTTVFCGKRCNYDIEADPDKAEVLECADINAGSFHVVAFNELKKDTSFIVDRDRSIQVWNQPVYSLSSSVAGSRPPSNGSAPGTVKEQELKVTLVYTVEVPAQWTSHIATTRSMNLHYWVELDKKNNILGGSYESWLRTDFVWKTTNPDPKKFGGYFSGMAVIYTNSTGVRDVVSTPFHIAMDPLTAKHHHAFLTTPTGEFGIENYADNTRKSWSIVVPQEPAPCIAISFQKFATERFRDKLRIYEGANGEGALIAVLHGSLAQIPSEVRVRSSSAFVIFTSDGQDADKGFLASYRNC